MPRSEALSMTDVFGPVDLFCTNCYRFFSAPVSEPFCVAFRAIAVVQMGIFEVKRSTAYVASDGFAHQRVRLKFHQRERSAAVGTKAFVFFAVFRVEDSF